MDLTGYKGNIESWFLSRSKDEFPNEHDYVSEYSTIVGKLRPVQKQVTIGADFTDGTSLTWHDESHIKRVIKQASKLLMYTDVKISPFEVYVLLIAIQIHDIKNIEGRKEHENHAIEIFGDLEITGIVDSILLKHIGFIASCHAGSILVGDREEKDKINLLSASVFKEDKKIRPRFLAAILRLADEYADETDRAMGFLLKIGKIQQSSIIHQKHAQSLGDVIIEPNTGKVDFEYHIDVKDALSKFPKYIKDKDTFEDIYLLDEVFERTVKSHYETVYCMRFLRPDITITKLHISIEIEHTNIAKQFKIEYELEEVGYPNNNLTILGLCGDRYLKNGNGGYWSGENLKQYIEANNLTN